MFGTVRSRRHRSALVLLILASLATGCVKTREYKVARYEAGSQTLVQAVPRDGVYKVKWKVRDDYRGVDHTTRYLTRGTPVGFETAPDGSVVALVGDERVAVGEAHRRATYCCWYQKSKEQTQFAREVQEALLTTAGVTAIVGVGVIDALVDDDDNDCDPAYLQRQRHRRD